jgi:hypothetical protein
VSYNTPWAKIGEVNRTDHLEEEDSPFASLISVMTGIPIDCFGNWYYIRRKSVAQRMCWAAHRKTTRRGFDINMPLLYGEKEKAFDRLQHAILSSSGGDETLPAWGVRMVL